MSNSKISVRIERLSHDGRGIAHINGKTTFVWGALPGEEVRLKPVRSHRSYDEAQLDEVLLSSPERVAARCPHFGVCGGCNLQHLSSTAQIEHKQNAFLELLQHQAGVQPKTLLAPLIAEPWGYRRKARIGVKHVLKKNKVLVGFREQNGRYIADLSRCEVLDPRAGLLIEALSELIHSLSILNQIPQLEIAAAEDACAVIIRHLVPFSEEDLNKLKTFSSWHALKIYLQPGGANTVQLFYPEAESSLLSYSLPDYALTFKFHPTHFTQVNFAINRLMIAQALRWLELRPDDEVLDLFCGIGNFSLPIAQTATKVVGVEGDLSSVAQAKANAVLNKITNTEFHCANLFEATQEAAWAQASYTKILLDPPRAGAQEIIAQMSHWNPQRIVYVSCNPATLARDTKLLIKQGYQLEAAGMMDMFPHTQHVEAMALFTRQAHTRSAPTAQST